MIPFEKTNLSFEQDNQQDSLHKIFETFAKSQPDAPALIWKNDVITYSELESASSAAAIEMANLGVCSGFYVPILLPRHPKLIVSLLGVLKAGSAYALLDPDWPEDRLREVITTLNPPILITSSDSCSIEGIPSWNPFKESVYLQHPCSSYEVEPYSPCSVFFTSGTTGKPKGVISRHCGTTRLFKDSSFATFSSETVIPLAAALPWDAFSLELWGALLNGGTSWIIDEPYLSASVLRTGVLDYGVNAAWMTSSLFNMIVEEDLDAFTSLTQIMIGGEKLSTSHVKTFLEKHPKITLINGYGPVESTVFATTHNVTLSNCSNPSGIPIGVPVSGTEVYVLNDEEQLCEEGQTGEICIAGEGLAVGYLNDPKLTDKKFKEVSIKGARTRVYSTGDLGFWENDLLHFQGRQDRQVKIRGHRVELSEVEYKIEEYLQDIKSCRVIARRDASNLSQELIAFCIPKITGDPLQGASDVLKSRLVPYQCPVAVVTVDAFPLTPQGKLDEKTLLEMASNQSNKNLMFSTTRNEYTTLIEKRVAEVFCSVLGKSVVPSDISLKELGANSLDIGRICSRLGSQLNRTIPLSFLYQYSTIISLSKFLNENSNDLDSSTSSDYTTNNMSPMQLMYLTQHLVNPEKLTSRCLLTWLIVGDLDLKVLESAFKHVHQRNEALRSIYIPELTPTAQLNDASPPSLVVLPSQASREEAGRVLRFELSKNLDPTRGKIWRAAIVPIEESNTTILGCAVHHIAFDGYSEHLFSNELSESYNMVAKNSDQDFSCASTTNFNPIRTPCSLKVCIPHHAEPLIKELENVPQINWPDAEKRSVHNLVNNEEYSVTINKDLIKKIDDFAQKNNLSRFEILFHQWAQSLSNATKQHDFCIGVPVRQRHISESQNAIGCYINMLCIRVRRNVFEEATSGLRETSQIIQRVMAIQDIPFAQILQLVKPQNTGRTPLFQTLFALQDNPTPDLNLEGLETKFIRQPYLDLPLELHAEIWPEDRGTLRLAISRRPECVSSSVVQALADNFMRGLDQLLNGRSGAHSLRDF